MKARPRRLNYLIDWDTQIDFQRSTAATLFDDGVLTRWAIDEPRVTSDGSLFVEGSRINAAKWSTPQTNLDRWTQVGAGPDQVGPSGASNEASRIAVSSLEGQTMTGVPYNTVSLLVKGVGGVPIVICKNQVSGASIIFPKTLVPPGSASAWTKQSATGLGSPAGPNIAWRYRNMSADPVDIFGLQLNNKTWHGELIETVGTAVTGSADQAKVLSANVNSTLKSGVFSTTIVPTRASNQVQDGAMETLFSFGTGLNNRIVILPDNRVQVYVGAAGKVLTTALTWSRKQPIKLYFNSVSGKIKVEGATTGNGTYTGTSWTMPSGDLYLGNESSYATPYFGSISKPLQEYSF